MISEVVYKKGNKIVLDSVWAIVPTHFINLRTKNRHKILHYKVEKDTLNVNSPTTIHTHFIEKTILWIEGDFTVKVGDLLTNKE